MINCIKTPIYLDNASTTHVDKLVCLEMMRCLSEDHNFANPDSSHHSLGMRAHELVEIARIQISNLVHCDPREIIFTSGATESNNLALIGVAEALNIKGKHIIVSQTEHKAILETCRYLESKGYHVTYLKPLSNGLIPLDMLEDAITLETILVSIMHVNNELGVVQDIRSLADCLKKKNILFHVDAAQSVGKIPIDLREIYADLMSFSAHKLHGPKGIGALFIRDRSDIAIKPLSYGGGQERGLRSGTLATHQIAGMGKAFFLAKERLTKDAEYISMLSNRFCNGLKAISQISFNIERMYCIPHILNFRIENVDSAELLSVTPEIAAAVGSACNSRSASGSHVLRAIGLTDSQVRSSLRISLSRFNTIEEMDFIVARLKKMIGLLTKLKSFE